MMKFTMSRTLVITEADVATIDWSVTPPTVKTEKTRYYTPTPITAETIAKDLHVDPRAVHVTGSLERVYEWDVAEIMQFARPIERPESQRKVKS